MNSYLEQFAAFVKGDDAKVQAIKAQRAVDSALRLAIAQKDGETIRLENKIEKAKDALLKARMNNGSPDIDEPTEYVNALIQAKNDLTLAEEELEAHKSLLEFLKEQQVKTGFTKE